MLTERELVVKVEAQVPPIGLRLEQNFAVTHLLRVESVWAPGTPRRLQVDSMRTPRGVDRSRLESMWSTRSPHGVDWTPGGLRAEWTGVHAESSPLRSTLGRNV